MKRIQPTFDAVGFLGWRDICRCTDKRTVIACVIPPNNGVGERFALILPVVSLALCDSHPIVPGSGGSGVYRRELGNWEPVMFPEG
jgi:hypothetical protein